MFNAITILTISLITTVIISTLSSFIFYKKAVKKVEETLWEHTHFPWREIPDEHRGACLRSILLSLICDVNDIESKLKADEKNKQEISEFLDAQLKSKNTKQS